jgi:cytoskeletal protein RodZ
MLQEGFMSKDQNNDHKPLTMREMLQSMLAGALGVQTGKNRARDFSRGKPSQFLMLGVLFMVLFVLIVLGAVKLVLHFSNL